MDTSTALVSLLLLGLFAARIFKWTQNRKNERPVTAHDRAARREKNWYPEQKS